MPNVISPVSDKACNTPTEAAELWITPVNNAPIMTPIIGFANAVKIFVNSGISAKGFIVSDIICIPYINTAKPIRIEPILFVLSRFALIIIIIPIKAIIGEKDSGFNSLKKKLELSIPESDKIQAVSVVPTFEPMITPMVCPSSIIPEFTKPTSITVNADDDCIAIVIPAPSANDLNGLEVIALSIFSSFPPATFSRPDDITFIPYKKNAKPPHSVNIENISINLFPSLVYNNILEKNNYIINNMLLICKTNHFKFVTLL